MAVAVEMDELMGSDLEPIRPEEGEEGEVYNPYVAVAELPPSHAHAPSSSQHSHSGKRDDNVHQHGSGRADAAMVLLPGGLSPHRTSAFTDRKRSQQRQSSHGAQRRPQQGDALPGGLSPHASPADRPHRSRSRSRHESMGRRRRRSPVRSQQRGPGGLSLSPPPNTPVASSPHSRKRDGGEHGHGSGRMEERASGRSSPPHGSPSSVYRRDRDRGSHAHRAKRAEARGGSDSRRRLELRREREAPPLPPQVKVRGGVSESKGKAKTVGECTELTLRRACVVTGLHTRRVAGSGTGHCSVVGGTTAHRLSAFTSVAAAATAREGAPSLTLTGRVWSRCGCLLEYVGPDMTSAASAAAGSESGGGARRGIHQDCGAWAVYIQSTQTTTIGCICPPSESLTCSRLANS